MKSKKPLENIKVLITRGKDGAREMSSLIEENGGVPVVVPLLQFQPFSDENENVYLSNLHTYEWIIFTSKNGVKFFLESLKRRNLELSSFKGKYAAVGSKTKQMCEEHGLSISFIPEDYTAEDFAEQFITKVNPTGGVLIPKGNLAGDVIASALIEANIPCSEWLVYETILPAASEIKLREMYREESRGYYLFY